MLVLSRKVGEEIVVPETGLVLTVLQVEGATVRLGWLAPPEVHIYRREVWDRIQAARGPGGDDASPAKEEQLPLQVIQTQSGHPL